MENLRMADRKARNGKRHSHGVKIFDKDAEGNLARLRRSLLDGTFRTSESRTFTIYEPKERVITCLPYYPDRIVDHAIINVTGPIWLKTFSPHQYNCIKGKGIHRCASDLKRALRRDPDGTRYCLKTDIRKYYPSIDHDCLKAIIRRRIKDERLLRLIDGIIDSTEGDTGLPIGRFLSQYLANLYLAYLLHSLKRHEDFRRVHLFTYADDFTMLAGDKERLHRLQRWLAEALAGLRLQMKPNWQIFPVETRGIDFVGYVFRHSHTRLRKTLKKRMAGKRKNRDSMTAYVGWAAHCDSKNLIKKLTT